MGTEEIEGVPVEEITIHKPLRMTCLDCEDLRVFNPLESTETGLTYGCAECGREAELAL